MKLWKNSAIQLAEIFAKGEASALEIIQAHLDRIDEINPKINAISHRIDDQALAAAQAMDEVKAKGEKLGPLAGVPFSIKSNVDIMGSPTDNGVPALAQAIPDQDSVVVARMKAAGAIPLARTNLPDLGLRMHTHSILHGQTLNPWNKEHTTGGSSGGEGAALATGMSPIGLGNDLGGSLRNPATCCSVASIKPTFGAIPRVPIIPALPNSIMLQVLISEGPMARTIDDVTLGLNVLSGVHPSDPWSRPVPLTLKEGQKRIAVLAVPDGGKTDDKVTKVVLDAAAVLRDAGHIVEEVKVPKYAEVVKCWYDLVIGGIEPAIEEMKPMVSEAASDYFTYCIKEMGPFGQEVIDKAWVTRNELIAEWNHFFRQWDAILTPTWTQLPVKAGSDAESREGAAAMLDTCRTVYPGNVLGYPSVAVPAGLVDGLPVGVLINGPYWSDLTCLQLAKCIEDAQIAPQTPIDPKF